MRGQRRQFLAAAAAAVGAGVWQPRRVVAAVRQQPLLQLGLIADAQYADSDPRGTRHYRASLSKLGAAVEQLNREEVAFSVHLGDLIDHTWNSFDAILQPLAESRTTVFQLLGNHDFDVLDELKPRVPGRLSLPQRYYYFDRAGFRFVVLDTNDVSVYGHVTGTPEHSAAAEELRRLQALQLRQAQSWNGGLSAAQLRWFEDTCRAAGVAGLRVIVLAHHPVFPQDVHNVWNSDQVLEVLDRCPQVVAWLNGHNHAGHFGERQGVPFVTLRGMVETADTTAWAVGRLFADRLVLEGHGREPSRELVFRS